MKIIPALFPFLFIAACSTKSMVTVNTTPSDAQVFARTIGTANKVELGKAPVRISASELRKKINSDNPVEIIVSKDGYVTENFVTTDYYNNNLSLELNLTVASTIQDGKKVDQIVEGLFECHRLMKSKKISEAQERISKLIEVYPHVSSLHEFQGSIYYVLNEKAKAYDSFTMAVKYNEENEEARRMISILQAINQRSN